MTDADRPEATPAIPAATVVLVRDGDRRARGADAAPGVEGGLRRDVGVPRRQGRRRRPPAGRRRGGRGAAGGRPRGARGVRPRRRPRRPRAVLPLGAAARHPAAVLDPLLPRSGERRRGRRRRRRDPRARVAGGPRGARSARPWRGRPGPADLGHAARPRRARHGRGGPRPAAAPRPGPPLRDPLGHRSTAGRSRCGRATAATRPTTRTQPGGRHRLWMLEDGWRLERS